MSRLQQSICTTPPRPTRVQWSLPATNSNEPQAPLRATADQAPASNGGPTRGWEAWGCKNR
eukprot:3647718-Alexandrium_andersonii.AAC.1